VRVTYVLDRPELCGGVKVVFQHAELLRRQGCEATVLGRGPRPEWVDFAGAYTDYSAGAVTRTAQDLVVATYWTTLATADALGLGPVAHFCQGYEGDLVHLAAARPEIEATYARRLPTFVVAPHLADLVRRRFGRESRLVPPPLDPRYRPAWRLRPRRTPWVMIPGIYEAEVKDVATALEAVARLRNEGCRCRVLRVSTLPLSTAERTLLEPDRYLCGVTPEVVAREMRKCDLLLFPSREMEGFGLPLLEAMGSKVPVVASRIPSTEFIGAGRLLLVAPRDATAFAQASRTLLEAPVRWRRARRDGYRAARQFRAGVVGPQLMAAVGWAIGRARAA
jgi:glycosyltransferase involved in cell wall biosynthesis